MSSDEFWHRVLTAVDGLARASYYDVLGLPRGASTDAVRDAHLRLARELHPDRHIRETDPRRTRALARLYARATEAARVLSDPVQRADYDRSLATGSTRLRKPRGTRGPAQDPRSPAARKLYETGKRLLDAGQTRAARAQLELAQQLEPDSQVIAAALGELGPPEPSAPPAPPKPDASPPPVPAAPAAVLDDQPTSPWLPAQRETGATYEPPVPTLTESDLFDSGVFEDDDPGAAPVSVGPDRELRRPPPKR